jgi:hypothetical protein
MRVKELVKQVLKSNKGFIHDLKVRKRLNEYAAANDILALYSKVHNDYSPVFVLSTGRCGTSFLTHILADEKKVNAVHEPHPEFFHHTVMAYQQHRSNSEKVSAVFDVARYEMIRNAFVMEEKYIETNNRVTFFANQIALLYPKAKFIHLIRNPNSFIKSGLGRNWYSGHSLYDEGKISASPEVWQNFSQTEKIGWLWNETNSFIEEFKSKMASHAVITVKAEELFKDTETQRNIFRFCEIKVPNDSVLRRKASKRINEGSKIILSEEQNGKISEIAGRYPLSAKYGY